MLSVVIVNWNTRDLLLACLRSIVQFEPAEPYEVIVVDNDSTDGSAEAMRAEFPSFLLIASPTNTGYAQGNNLGFEKANGEFVLTLNPDTEFVDDSLQRAIDWMRAHPKVGCIGAKQIGPDGNVQRSVRGFPTARGILGDLTGLGRSNPGSAWDSYRMTGFDYEKEGPAPQPMGTFLLFRRAALEAAGSATQPFDTRFPIFFNEVDLLYRAKKAGWHCWYVPSVRILHHGGESTKQVRKNMIWESHKSLVRFLRKHYATPWNLIGLALVGALVYLAAFVRARGYHAGFRT